MDITCNVIEDLLPLYADGICSEDSKTIVEHHIAVCPECKAKLEAMTAKIETTEPSKSSAPKNPFKKIRRCFKLIITALCICVVIAVPAVIGTVMAVNDIYDQGYSWSTLSFEIKMRKFGNMLKNGKYREALDTIDYNVQSDYTSEELSALKDLFAEDLENYFNRFPIKKIRVEGEKGNCRYGYLFIDLKTDIEDKNMKAGQMIYFNYSDTNPERLGYAGNNAYLYDDSALDDNPNQSDRPEYDELNNGFPEMWLAAKSLSKSYFDKLKDDDKIGSAAFYLFSEEKWEDISDYGWVSIDQDNEAKLRRMLESYEYIDCECGDMTYMRETIFKTHSVDRFYCQYVTLIMRTNDGEEFTVSFDMPIILTGFPEMFSSVRNITYSDNAPEDFKTQFESVFAQ